MTFLSSNTALYSGIIPLSNDINLELIVFPGDFKLLLLLIPDMKNNIRGSSKAELLFQRGHGKIMPGISKQEVIADGKYKISS